VGAFFNPIRQCKRMHAFRELSSVKISRFDFSQYFYRFAEKFSGKANMHSWRSQKRQNPVHKKTWSLVQPPFPGMNEGQGARQGPGISGWMVMHHHGRFIVQLGWSCVQHGRFIVQHREEIFDIYGFPYRNVQHFHFLRPRMVQHPRHNVQHFLPNVQAKILFVQHLG